MKRDQFEEISLVNRLWGYYLRQGLSPEQAMTNVESKLDGSYAAAVKTVKSMVLRDEGAVLSDASQPAFFTSLLKDVRELGGNDQHVAADATQALHRAAAGFKSCSRFFSSLYIYPTMILFVSTIIYFCYRLFVFPQMVSAIGDLEIFPALSRAVFSSVGGVVVFILLAILIIIAIWQNRKLLRAFASYQPANSFFGRLISTDQHQRYLLFLVYLTTLLKSGLKPSDSIHKAKTYTRLDENNAPYYKTHQAALSVVQIDEGDLVEEEIDFQLNDVLNGLDSVLSVKQEKILFMFQAFIFVFVGLMVVAMYLPIFQLANIV